METKKNIEINIKTEDCSFKFEKHKYSDVFKVKINNYMLTEEEIKKTKLLFKLIKETWDKNQDKDIEAFRISYYNYFNKEICKKIDNLLKNEGLL